jgi:hypothetical protein
MTSHAAGPLTLGPVPRVSHRGKPARNIAMPRIALRKAQKNLNFEDLKITKPGENKVYDFKKNSQLFFRS